MFAVAGYLRRIDRSLGKPLAHFLLPLLNSSYFYIVSRGRDEFRIAAGRPKDDLTLLCDKYRTDKGSLVDPALPPPHNYAAFYDFLFRNRRLQIKNFLECGIGTTDINLHSNMGESGIPGASLRVWKRYFPNAEIHGIDIDPGVIFQEKRITTAVVDQTNEAQIVSYLGKVTDKELRFDVMIDDGMHSATASTTFLRSSIRFLSDDGLYIVEDLNPMMHLSLVRTVKYLGLAHRLIRVTHRPICQKLKERSMTSSNLMIITKKCSLLQFAT